MEDKPRDIGTKGNRYRVINKEYEAMNREELTDEINRLIMSGVPKRNRGTATNMYIASTTSVASGLATLIGLSVAPILTAATVIFAGATIAYAMDELIGENGEESQRYSIAKNLLSKL